MKRRKSLDSSGPLKTLAEAELAIGRRQVAEEAIDRLNNEIHVIDARGNVMPRMAQQKRTITTAVTRPVWCTSSSL